MWLAQYLNASDKQKNTPGSLGRDVALWSANGKFWQETAAECQSRPRQTWLSSPSCSENTAQLGVCQLSLKLTAWCDVTSIDKSTEWWVATCAVWYLPLTYMTTRLNRKTESTSHWFLDDWFEQQQNCNSQIRVKRVRRFIALHSFTCQVIQCVVNTREEDRA